jgi:hypothetical protein
MLWFGSKGARYAISFADEWCDPGLARRAETQAEAGPLMLMVRRANMGLSIAASGVNRKALPGTPGVSESS